MRTNSLDNVDLVNVLNLVQAQNCFAGLHLDLHLSRAWLGSEADLMLVPEPAQW